MQQHQDNPAKQFDPEAIVGEKMYQKLVYYFHKVELSKREQDVATRVVLTGKEYKEVAFDLCVAHETVAYHMSVVRTKTGFKTRAALIAHCQQVMLQE